MDDITRFLLSGTASPTLTASSLQDMGKRASAMYLDGGMSLNEAVVKVASERGGVTAEQVMRIVENANSATFLDIFEKQAGDRNVHFEVCDPRVVLRTLNIRADAVKEASDHDYAVSPESLGVEKTAGSWGPTEESKKLVQVMDAEQKRLGKKNLSADEITNSYRRAGFGKKASLRDLEADLTLADVFGVNLSTLALNKVAEEEGKKDLPVEKNHEDILSGGRADDSSTSDFSHDQLKKGVSVEMEHTNTPALAQEIAEDHLEELPDYYDRLEEMEEEGKRELKKAAMRFLKVGGRGSDLVLHDLAKAASIENVKKASVGKSYPDADPFGELVRTHQRLTKVAEDAGLALLKSEEMRKESEATFVHELKQHMLDGGNLGEVVHALSSVGSPGQVKEAMAFAVPQLAKHGLDLTKSRAALAAYEMTKAASVRTANPESPLIRSFCGMIKSGADRLQLAESTKTLNTYKNKVASMMAKVSHVAQK